MLLLLDNFEQLLAAGPLVSDLLKQTRALKVVVTSRASLHVSGEQEYRVPPLALPDPSAPNLARNIAECESVRLFVERARAAEPDF